MARSLDGMYFTHAQIFTMRSRPWPVLRAKELLSRSSAYAQTLPATVFSCGAPLPPAEFGGDPAKTMRELNLLLRAKMVLEPLEPALAQCVRVKVDGGVLCASYDNYFELYMTLKSLDAYSVWTVLGTLYYFLIYSSCFKSSASWSSFSCFPPFPYFIPVITLSILSVNQFLNPHSQKMT